MKTKRNVSRIMCFFLGVVIVFFFSGCSGHLYTILNPDTGSNTSEEKKIEGILVYPVKFTISWGHTIVKQW